MPRTENIKRLIFSLVIFSALVGIFFSNLSPVKAATSDYIHFQSKLVNSDGTNVADGTYNFKFVIYTTSSGDTGAVWSEEQDNVSVQNGVLDVDLGSNSNAGLTDSVFDNSDLYLQICLDANGTTGDGTDSVCGSTPHKYEEVFSTRMALTSVAYAFAAKKLLNDAMDTSYSADEFLKVKESNVWNPDAGSLTFAFKNTSGGDLLYVDSYNNFVGIGVNSGSSKLNVYNSGAELLRLWSDYNVTSDTSGTLLRVENTSTANNRTILRLRKVSSSGSSYYGDFRLNYNGTLEWAIGTQSSELVTPKMVLNSSGYLGIGTTSPSYTLDVNGDTHISGALYDSSSSAGSNGQILQSTGSGIAWVDPSNIATDGDWTVSGSDMYSAVSGNVGIGTSSPSTKLHVYSSSDNTLLTLENSTQGAYVLMDFMTGGQTWTIGANDSDGSFYFSSASASKVMTFAGGSTPMVGIGTSSPSYILDVDAGSDYDVATFSSDYKTDSRHLGAIVRIVNTSYADNRSILRFVKNYSSGTYYGDFRMDYDGNFEWASGTTSGDLDSPKMVLTYGGGLGIGTTTPSSKLDVVGNIEIGDYIFFGNNSSNYLRFAGTGFYLSDDLWPSSDASYDLGNSSERWRDLYLSGSSLHMGVDGDESTLKYTGSALEFRADSTVTDAQMILTDDGNVGIGTITPNYKLTVDGGTAGFPGFFTTNDIRAGIVLQNEATTGTDNSTEVRFMAWDGSAISTQAQLVYMDVNHATYPNQIHLRHWGSTGGIAFQTNGLNTRMFIDSSGNVGIGTSHPSTTLDVVGNIELDSYIFFDNTASNYLRFAGTGFYLSDDLWPSSDASYNLGSSTSRWKDLYLSGSSLHMGVDGNESTLKYTGSALEFRADSTVTDAQMVLTDNGNVGIGTSTPQQALDVDGGFYLRAQSTAPASPSLGYIYTNTDGNLYFYNGTAWEDLTASGGGTSNAWLQGGNSWGAAGVLGTTDAHDLNVITNNTTRMTVTSGGDLGVGTASPGTLLDIYSDSTKSLVHIGSTSSGTFSEGGMYFLSRTSTQYLISSGIYNDGSNWILTNQGGNTDKYFSILASYRGASLIYTGTTTSTSIADTSEGIGEYARMVINKNGNTVFGNIDVNDTNTYGAKGSTLEVNKVGDTAKSYIFGDGYIGFLAHELDLNNNLIDNDIRVIEGVSRFYSNYDVNTPDHVRISVHGTLYNDSVTGLADDSNVTGDDWLVAGALGMQYYESSTQWVAGVVGAVKMATCPTGYDCYAGMFSGGPVFIKSINANGTGLGTNGQVLTSTGTSITWSDPAAIADAWSINGNSGTDPSVNFLGTTDNTALIFKTNGNEKMRISEETTFGDVLWGIGIGTSSTDARLSVEVDNSSLDVFSFSNPTSKFIMNNDGRIGFLPGSSTFPSDASDFIIDAVSAGNRALEVRVDPDDKERQVAFTTPNSNVGIVMFEHDSNGYYRGDIRRTTSGLSFGLDGVSATTDTPPAVDVFISNDGKLGIGTDNPESATDIRKGLGLQYRPSNEGIQLGNVSGYAGIEMFDDYGAYIDFKDNDTSSYDSGDFDARVEYYRFVDDTNPSNNKNRLIFANYNNDSIEFFANGFRYYDSNGQQVKHNDLAAPLLYYGINPQYSDYAYSWYKYDSSWIFLMRLTDSGDLYVAGDLNVTGSVTASSYNDIAENIKVADSSINAGDIVIGSSFDGTEDNAYDASMAAKSSIFKDKKILGVISSKPGILLNAGDDLTENSTSSDFRPLTLAGRVPTKVFTIPNQVINEGDPITSSYIAGIGQKATEPGTIVGKALEPTTNWSDATCQAVDSIDDITWPEDDGSNPDKPCYKVPVSSLTDEAKQNLEDMYGLTESDYIYVGKIMVYVGVGWYEPSEYVQKINELLEAYESGSLTGGGATTNSYWTKENDTTISTAYSVLVSDLTSTQASINILKAQTLTIGDNAFVVDSDGNLSTQGDINAKDISGKTVEAKTVSTSKINIDTSSADSPTAGKATITAGQTEVFINTKSAKQDSVIIVTPNTLIDKPLVVTEIQDGVGFKVQITAPYTEDINFSWMIVTTSN